MKIDNLKIFSGRANPDLAKKICAHLSAPLGSVVTETFPDSETYVQILDHIRGDDVFIIQPTCRPTNDNLMELLIIIRT